MKVVKTIKNIIIGVLVIVFFVFAIGMTVFLLNVNDYGVTQFGDTTVLMVKEKISSENYKKGDLLFVEKRELNDLKVGNEIFVYKVLTDGSVRIDVGKIGEIHENDNAISFENGGGYGIDNVIGEVTKTYNGLGTYLSVILSKWGFLFIILIPSFLLFVYELYALVVEIKYGKE